MADPGIEILFTERRTRRPKNQFSQFRAGLDAEVLLNAVAFLDGRRANQRKLGWDPDLHVQLLNGDPCIPRSTNYR